MKIRESGMPEETYWESLFDTQLILSKLEFDESINDAVEFGSGYGTFTIPAAYITKGKIIALDIDSGMIDRLNQRIDKLNLTNIKIIKRDFIKEGTGLKDSSIDYAMLFNILHAENPYVLLNETYRILKNTGKVGVTHWKYDSETPRGPSMAIRPKPEELSAQLVKAGFAILKYNINLPPYHYGILAQK